jgi:hypothetical protein
MDSSKVEKSERPPLLLAARDGHANLILPYLTGDSDAPSSLVGAGSRPDIRVAAATDRQLRHRLGVALIINAVRGGQVALVQELLRLATPPFDDSLLSAAAASGNMDMLRLLEVNQLLGAPV